MMTQPEIKKAEKEIKDLEAKVDSTTGPAEQKTAIKTLTKEILNGEYDSLFWLLSSAQEIVQAAMQIKQGEDIETACNVARTNPAKF